MVEMDRFLDFNVVMCLPRWGKQNLWLFLSSVKIVVRRCEEIRLSPVFQTNVAALMYARFSRHNMCVCVCANLRTTH